MRVPVVSESEPPSPSRRGRRLVAGLALAAAVAGAGGCATRPPADAPEAVAEFEETNDPLEPTNRVVFAFNRVVDEAILQPASRTYRTVVPLGPRLAIRNILTTLGEPAVAANDLLQGNPERAGIALGRLVVNATLGFLGVFDVATEMGLVHHDEDFGQTLAVWGVGDGPYLMLPILGPSNPRDAVGWVVDFLADPVDLATGGSDADWLDDAETARTPASVLDRREAVLDPLDELEETSIDFYAAIRSTHRQRRDTLIRNSSDAPATPALQLSRDGGDDSGRDSGLAMDYDVGGTRVIKVKGTAGGPAGADDRLRTRRLSDEMDRLSR